MCSQLHSLAHNSHRLLSQPILLRKQLSLRQLCYIMSLVIHTINAHLIFYSYLWTWSLITMDLVSVTMTMHQALGD